MKAVLSNSTIDLEPNKIKITGSKSESNRLLVLQALYPEITIENISESDDTMVLQKGLQSDKGTVDIHHAGTAMRFLTAYFASQNLKEVVVTGSHRMQERPIRVLVDALRDLGADIEYTKNEGYPPLKISGKKLLKNTVTIKANVSSQYISALMLIAPSLPKGLTVFLEGKITSVPYIKMTLRLLHQIGVEAEFAGNTICVKPLKKAKKTIVHVESDWSSASYFYSIIALSKNGSVQLQNYNKDSLQGDSKLAELYKSLGVGTEFIEKENTIRLYKETPLQDIEITFDLSNTPDIAQTIAVTCFGLQKSCYLTGLHTLKIKETDRLKALKIELGKLGARVDIVKDSLKLYPSSTIFKDIEIDTYNDHRMAMAFAPLALKTPLVIKDCEVVSKSYPTFWEDLVAIGLDVETQEE